MYYTYHTHSLPVNINVVYWSQLLTYRTVPTLVYPLLVMVTLQSVSEAEPKGGGGRKKKISRISSCHKNCIIHLRLLPVKVDVVFGIETLKVFARFPPEKKGQKESALYHI